MKKVFGSIAGYLKQTDIIFWLLSLAVTAYGCILISSLDRATTKDYLKTQIMAVTLGYIAAFIISKIDYEFFGRVWLIVAIGCVGVVLLTFTPMGITIGGTDDRAWLDLKITTFQPAELMKIGFIITFSKHLSYLKDNEKLKSFLQICGLGVHALIPVAIVHLQGDDGTALVFAFMFLIMTFAAGVQLRYFLVLFAGGLAAIPLIWNKLMHDEQRARFLALLDLDASSMGKGYQQFQGKTSIASGQLFGRGLYEGPRVTNGNVPYQENDFILTVAGEELGFIGCVILLLLLLFFMLRALQVSFKAKDNFGKYICIGFFAMIATQTCINVGMCLGLIPVIGITLPFLSAGGSSVACLYLGVGLVVSVYMHRFDADHVTLKL